MYAPKQSHHQNMHTPFGREYKVVSTLGLPWPPPHPITHAHSMASVLILGGGQFCVVVKMAMIYKRI